MGKYSVLSLFDGISCGRIALERAGIKVGEYFASEIDKYAIQVSKANWPGIVQLGDVTKVKAADLPKIDIIFGGFPCQAFSFSGKRLNFDDPRGKLFFECVRLLKEVREQNPDVFFLFENVKMKKEWQDAISAELGVEPHFVNSELVSGQNRQRLYWTNIPWQGLPEDKHIELKDVLESGFVDRDKSYCLDANYFKGGNLTQYFQKSRRQLVFPTKEDLELGRAGDSKAKYRKLTPLECERLQNLPENYTAAISNTQRYKCVGNGWTVGVIEHIFKGLKK